MSTYTIHGTVSEGFEPVKEIFEKYFIDKIEENAQLCVYVGECKVIDLWGVTNNEVKYNEHSVTMVFSCSKNLSAICMATLVDKGLLDYSDKVIKHWPEYGDGDKAKESMTIAQIMRHEGGMPQFTKTLTLADIQRENIKNNSIGGIIEKEPLHFPPLEAGTKTEYHALNRGYILNEIFRQVDPQQRTIGECLREDIATPLNADTFIGLNYAELPRSVNATLSSVSDVIRGSFLPKYMGTRTVEPSVADIMKVIWLVGSQPIPIPPLEQMTAKITDNISELLSKFEYSVMKTGEIPSANAQCSARGIARLSAMMANKGKLEGIQIMSEETWNKLHSNYQNKLLYPFNERLNFSQGGVNLFTAVTDDTFLFKSNEYRQGYIGWIGFGGSVFQWHPEYKIGFGYVPTFLKWEDFGNTKAALLQKSVLDCIEKINSKDN